MKTNIEILKEVAAALNVAFAFIADFKVYQTENVIKGGFCNMSYRCPVLGEMVHYKFHDLFIRLEADKVRESSFEEIFKKAHIQILEDLKWHKACDEAYAKEYEKKIEYKYDYSILQ